MKKGLGRGLDAIIPGGLDTAMGLGKKAKTDQVAIDAVKPNPYQPRKEIKEEKLAEMTESIKQFGVVQPILVVRDEDNFILVAGERRLRAAKRAGLKLIPAVVGSFSKQEMMEIALVENLQREDLNPLEESIAFKKLIDEFSLTQEEVALKIGKSRSYVANSIRLLSFDEDIQREISSGNIKVGQVRPLLAIEDPVERKKMARMVLEKGLNSREAEELARLKRKKNKSQSSLMQNENPFLIETEERIRKKLGTKVKIKMKEKEGKIELTFYGTEDLNRLIDLILTIQ